MVVDDDPDVRESLCTYLRCEGFEPVPCRSAEAALAKLVYGAEPAVIVVDLAMPGIGGAAFIRKIRASPFAHVPLLLLSGWGHVDRFQLDVDRIIAKPFEPASLARAVDRLASTRSHGRSR